MTITPQILAARAVAYRTAKRYSQMQMARELGLPTQSLVSRLERGTLPLTPYRLAALRGACPALFVPEGASTALRYAKAKRIPYHLAYLWIHHPHLYPQHKDTPT